jgi:hypothetical protein
MSLVEMGFRVSAMVNKFISWERERRFSASNEPLSEKKKNPHVIAIMKIYHSNQI